MHFGIFAQEMIDISIRVTFGKPPIKIKDVKKPRLSQLQKIQRLKLRVLEKRVSTITFYTFFNHFDRWHPWEEAREKLYQAEPHPRKSPGSGLSLPRDEVAETVGGEDQNQNQEEAESDKGQEEVQEEEGISGI